MENWGLTDEGIIRTLERIQPEGFDWATTTASEMIKFRAVIKAQLAKLAVPDEQMVELLDASDITLAQNSRKTLFRQLLSLLQPMILAVRKAGYRQGGLDEIEACDARVDGAIAQAVKKERERIYYLGFEKCKHGNTLRTCNRCWQALKGE